MSARERVADKRHLRLTLAGMEENEAARKVAVQLREWASRDRVPWLADATRSLAEAHELPLPCLS